MAQCPRYEKNRCCNLRLIVRAGVSYFDIAGAEGFGIPGERFPISKVTPVASEAEQAKIVAILRATDIKGPVNDWGLGFFGE